MKVVRKTSWELPPLEHFRDELEWDVNSMEEVLEYLNDYAMDELCDMFGWYPIEETFIEK